MIPFQQIFLSQKKLEFSIIGLLRHHLFFGAWKIATAPRVENWRASVAEKEAPEAHRTTTLSLLFLILWCITESWVHCTLVVGQLAIYYYYYYYYCYATTSFFASLPTCVFCIVISSVCNAITIRLLLLLIVHPFSSKVKPSSLVRLTTAKSIRVYYYTSFEFTFFPVWFLIRIFNSSFVMTPLSSVSCTYKPMSCLNFWWISSFALFITITITNNNNNW